MPAAMTAIARQVLRRSWFTRAEIAVPLYPEQLLLVRLGWGVSTSTSRVTVSVIDLCLCLSTRGRTFRTFTEVQSGEKPNTNLPYTIHPGNHWAILTVAGAALDSPLDAWLS